MRGRERTSKRVFSQIEFKRRAIASCWCVQGRAGDATDLSGLLCAPQQHERASCFCEKQEGGAEGTDRTRGLMWFESNQRRGLMWFESNQRRGRATDALARKRAVDYSIMHANKLADQLHN